MKITQEQAVKNRLNEIGYVDNFWAIENYILRLGAIMCQLKKQGYDFETSFGDGKEKKNYRYTLKSLPPREIRGFVTIAGKRIEIYK